jgi:hypothetical protein
LTPHSESRASRPSGYESGGAVGQGVAVGTEVGVKVPRPVARPSRRWLETLGDPRNAVDEREPGLAATADRVAESGLDDRLDHGGPRSRRGVGLGVTDGATARLEIAQLDEQEVVLAERVRQLCTRHPDQWQELLVGQEVPVASEHRDIRPASQAWGNVSSFAGEKLRLASKLLNFMCAHDFAKLRIKKTNSRLLRDKRVRSRWNVRSPYVRDIAVRLQVDPVSLTTFLEELGFNPAGRVNPPPAQRDRWIEKRWE